MSTVIFSDTLTFGIHTQHLDTDQSEATNFLGLPTRSHPFLLFLAKNQRPWFS